MCMPRWFIWVLVFLMGSNVLAVGISTTAYYDNRKAAVVWTADDLLAGREDSFFAAAELARTNGMVISLGVITRSMAAQTWSELQGQMDRGCVVPVNHSYTHKVPQAPSWFSTNIFEEVHLSTIAIKSHLVLPWQSTYDESEFLTGWVQPYGSLPEPYATEMRTQLVAHNYLASRWINVPKDFAEWAEDGMYENVGIGIAMQTVRPEVVFDNIYAANGICHIYTHPWQESGDVRVGTKWTSLMSHVGNRKDVWYVGFGHLYMYHYLQHQITPTMTLLTNDVNEVAYSISVSSAEREKYGLSYPITYKVTVPTSWPAAAVLYSDADTSGWTMMTEKTTNDFFNGENIYRSDLTNQTVYISQAFPQQHNEFQIKVINAPDPDSDTDGDGFDDAFEVANGLDPLISNTAIVSYIRANDQFGLYSEEDIGHLSMGNCLLTVSNGMLRFQLQLEQSPNLVTWTNCGGLVEWEASPDADTMFYRVKGSKTQ